MRLYDDDGQGVPRLRRRHRLGQPRPRAPRGGRGGRRADGKLVQVANLYYVEHRDELAEVLVGLFGGERKVFFANSGAEANEGAIKLARKWGKARRGDDVLRHRDRASAASTAGRSRRSRRRVSRRKQEAFAPLPAGLHARAAQRHRARSRRPSTTETCAVMLEPIQGEGGVFPCDAGYLADVQRLCDERDVLLILDEVQTGFFRTGAAFAHQRDGTVRPRHRDAARSRSPTACPIGAVVATDEVAAAFQPGDHGSTFGGGPVVCAAALATIGALIGEDLGGNAERDGRLPARRSSTRSPRDTQRDRRDPRARAS